MSDKLTVGRIEFGPAIDPDYLRKIAPFTSGISHNVQDALNGAADVIAQLTKENERLRKALTPSPETKAAYSGEFFWLEEECDDAGYSHNRRFTVPWAVIKEIMATILSRAKARGRG